jgi:hypothetical protein
MANIEYLSKEERDRIRNNIENASDYFLQNNRNFHKFKRFIYKSNLTNTEVNDLAKIDKPDLQFNVLEAYVSRLKGEFSKQEPSINVSPLNESISPLLVEVVQAHIAYLLKEANSDKFQTRAYDDCLSGGFSVFEVWTEYKNKKSLQQNLRVGKLPDPTLAIFDPLARASHKGDGNFCAKFYPLAKEQFEKEYPGIDINTIPKVNALGTGFRWVYESVKQKIIMVCDYYEKVEKKYEIVMLSSGQEMSTSEYNKMVNNWSDIKQPPVIVNRRKSFSYDIVRYKIVGDQLLEKPEKTDFEELPLVFVDGNSTMICDTENSMARQFTRPYFYQAIDAQRFKNFAGQTLASEISNMVSAKFLVEANSIPANQAQFWANPSRVTALVYNSRDLNGNELPPPSAIPRSPIPAEIYQAFEGSDRAIQGILGSYDASVGKTEKDLSGRALIESASQSNAAAMPYIYNFMAAIEQVGRILLNLIPKYYVTPRTIPILLGDGKREYVEINKDIPSLPSLMMDFDPDDLNLTVEASANFRVQQSQDLETLISLSQINPKLGQFMADEGLPFILRNVDVKGIDELRQKFQEWSQEKQSQPPQPDPMIALKQQSLSLQQQKQSQDYQLKMLEMQQNEKELEEARLRLILDASQSSAGHKVQLTKAETERQAKAAEFLMKQAELSAKHEELQFKKGEKNEEVSRH